MGEKAQEMPVCDGFNAQIYSLRASPLAISIIPNLKRTPDRIAINGRVSVETASAFNTSWRLV